MLWSRSAKCQANTRIRSAIIPCTSAGVWPWRPPLARGRKRPLLGVFRIRIRANVPNHGEATNQLHEFSSVTVYPC